MESLFLKRQNMVYHCSFIHDKLKSPITSQHLPLSLLPALLSCEGCTQTSSACYYFPSQQFHQQIAWAASLNCKCRDKLWHLFLFQQVTEVKKADNPKGSHCLNFFLWVSFYMLNLSAFVTFLEKRKATPWKCCRRNPTMCSLNPYFTIHGFKKAQIQKIRDSWSFRIASL